MANKITKAQMFTMIKALDEVQANPDMVAFIDHELELLSKKAGNKKPTKTQEENVKLKDIILEVLTNVGATVTEIQNRDERLKEYNGVTISNQKISALLKQMCDDGQVVKIVEKKKSYFSLLLADQPKLYVWGNRRNCPTLKEVIN